MDQDSWERRWTRVLGDAAHDVARRPPNAHVLTEAADLPPGRALDAGAGHGAETRWLAGRGWEVTAVDFSATALGQAREFAEAEGVAAAVTWLEADLGAWSPPAARYDLVLCIHVNGDPDGLIRRLGSGVAPGGTLLLVGREAPGQVQVSVADARAALDPADWELLVAEDRGVDAVIRARRRAG